MKQQHVDQLVRLCKQPGRTQQDIWFIRDRLHESSSFFKLWPSQLQQLLCRLAQARQWVKNEVLAARHKPAEDLCFILEGQAAVAVRSAPGSSLLKDVAVLQAGDTFGELCLLGKQRHPAFVVVRSAVLTGLTINAKELAAAMAALLHQAPEAAGTCNTSSTAHAAAAAAGVQQEAPSLDALYELMGEPRGRPQAGLKAQQAGQVRQLYSRQLQEAAEAEAATVGAWQRLPHERLEQPPGRPAGAAAQEAPDEQQPSTRHAGAQQTVQRAGSGDGHMHGSTRRDSSSRSSVPDGVCLAGAESVAAQGAVEPASMQEQQQQEVHRSPLMHHAAIMHFAALRAATVAQPSP